MDIGYSMADDSDIRRFIQAVKTEADKEEDFVLARVEETYPTLWNLMKTRYANFDELCAKALRTSTLYGKMEELVKKIDAHDKHIAMKETIQRRANRIATIISWSHKEFYDKFVFRYSRDDIEKLIKDLADPKRIATAEELREVGQVYDID